MPDFVGLKDIQNRNNPVVGDTSLVAFYFKLGISIQALTHTTVCNHSPYDCLVLVASYFGGRTWCTPGDNSSRLYRAVRVPIVCSTPASYKSRPRDRTPIATAAALETEIVVMVKTLVSPNRVFIGQKLTVETV